MNRVDRARVQVAFSRHAPEYDGHARVQRKVVERVSARVAALPRCPRRVLDVGAGTGTLLARVAGFSPAPLLAGVDLAPGMARAARERSPAARVALGDAERLPFVNRAFDLVLSTSTFQWLGRLDLAFAEARRVLEPGGLFCFALFCGRTLHEWLGCYRAALPPGASDRTHRFFLPGEVEVALAAAGLDLLELAIDVQVELHRDACELLRSLKRIGAGNAAPPDETGLAGRRVLLEAMRVYDGCFGGRDGVPATYEICYALARRPPPDSAAHSD